MTRDERIANFKTFIAEHVKTAEIREMALNVFEQGYDQGVADGIVRGQNYQAQITDMIFNPVRPDLSKEGGGHA